MNKVLLVGGDSFAEFPQYTYKLSTGEIMRDTSSNNTAMHWCQHWARRSGLKAVSSGIPGGDLSTSVHVCMREVLRYRPKVCVFFITNPFRTNIEVSRSEGQVRAYQLKFLDRATQWNRSLGDYFSSYEPAVGFPGTHYHTLEKRPGLEIDWTHVWERMDARSTHDFLTQSLGLLSALERLCNHTHTELVFTSGFAREEMWAEWVESVLGCRTFFFDLPCSHIELKSHFTAEEHLSIFRKLYPEFVNPRS